MDEIPMAEDAYPDRVTPPLRDGVCQHLHEELTRQPGWLRSRGGHHGSHAPKTVGGMTPDEG